MSFISKNFVKSVGLQYNLRNTAEELQIFNVLWELFQIGNKYRRNNRSKIEKGLEDNYLNLIGELLSRNEFKEFTSVDTFKNHVISNNIFKRIKDLEFKIQDPLQSRLKPRIKINLPFLNRIRNFTRSFIAPKFNTPPSKFVIFSDHHMTGKNHRNNYFGKNKGLYKEILSYYSDNGYALIENGDVEEYVIFEPTIKIANGYNNLIDKSGGIFGTDRDIGHVDWGALQQKRTENRIEILTKIISDNQDLYDLIENKFIKNGKPYYTKITGNHDPFAEQVLIDLLPEGFSNNLCDALKLTVKGADSGAKLRYFVTHGHQFDASTQPLYAYALGEVFSETLGWTIQGADRIWDSDKTDQWRNSSLSSTFRNVLATAMAEPDFGLNGGDELVAWFIEDLMQGHEIAWEYFDSPTHALAFQTEVMTGDEYFKVRHLSETNLIDRMESLYARTDIKDWRQKPKLIIGHTHEPRIQSRIKESANDIAIHYLNSGSAGRFENLIWGIELVNGSEKLISWTKEGNTIMRNQWNPTASGMLNKMPYPK